MVLLDCAALNLQVFLIFSMPCISIRVDILTLVQASFIEVLVYSNAFVFI